MPEYIGRNTQMLSEWLRTQQAKAEQPGIAQRAIAGSAEKVAQTVAQAVNEHYKAKEDSLKEKMAKLQHEKEAETALGRFTLEQADKEKRSMADYLSKFTPIINKSPQLSDIGLTSNDPINIPEGAVPTAGTYGQQFSQYALPVEKQFAPQKITQVGAAATNYNKVYPGLGVTPDMDNSLVKTMITQYNANKRNTATLGARQAAYAKYDPAYAKLSKLVEDLPGLDRKDWKDEDEVRYKAWLKATKDRGITIDDVQILSQAEPEEMSSWAKLMDLLGWKYTATPAAESTIKNKYKSLADIQTAYDKKEITAAQALEEENKLK